MDILDPSPMYQPPAPTLDPVDPAGRPSSPAAQYQRPPYLYDIGADPVFLYTRNEKGELIFPAMAQYVAAPVSSSTSCLLRLPVCFVRQYFSHRGQLNFYQVSTDGCHRCFLLGRACTFVVRGEACPPCLAGCLDCSFADRYLFLEALALFRDTGYASIRAFPFNISDIIFLMRCLQLPPLIATCSSAVFTPT